MKRLFSVMNEDADLCVMVPAASKIEARNTVYDLAKNPACNIASIKRLREVAVEKGVSSFVLLKTDEMVNCGGDSPSGRSVFLVDD
jgi:hypothetical protein